MTKKADNSVNQLANMLVNGSGRKQKLKLTGTSGDTGTDKETRVRYLPTPIGTAGQVLTVVTDGSDLVASWENSSGGGSALTVKDEGSNLDTAVTSIDFTGAGVTATHTSHAVSVAIPGYTDEQARDALGTALVAGNNIDITVNDVGDTITIDVETLTSVDITDFTEAVEDAIGTSAGSGFLLDTSSVAWTYNDGANTLAVNVKDEYVQDMMGGGFVVAGPGVDVTYNDGANTLTFGLSSAARTGTVNFLIDGGGSVITASIKGYFQADRAGSITVAKLLSTVSGSISVTIKKTDYSTFPTFTSIIASAPMVLSSAQKSTSSLTGWTTAFSAGDIFEVSVTGTPASVSQVLMALTVVYTA